MANETVRVWYERTVSHREHFCIDVPIEVERSLIADADAFVAAAETLGKSADFDWEEVPNSRTKTKATRVPR